MDSTRINRINRLLQKELNELFRLETMQLKGVLVSVTKVSISPDLSIAKVYLSIFPSERSKELFEGIKSSVKTVRYDLGERVGKQLRRIPDLSFFLDDSLDYLERIDELLEK